MMAGAAACGLSLPVAMSCAAKCRVLCCCPPPRSAAHAPWKAAERVPFYEPARRRRRRLVAVRPAASGSSGDEGSSSAIPDTLPVAGVDTDWRSFRAQLVAASAGASSPSSSSSEAAEPGQQAPAAAASGPGAAWAHSLPHPEQGCLLLANPLMFQTSQTYFYLSVILVYGHDERGAVGLILNRRTEYTVGQLQLRGDAASMLQPELNDCPLYLGGDVAEEALNLLHGVRGLGGAEEILPGVYLGGFPAAKAGIAEGRLTPDDFKVLNRCAGWGPGQLEAECRRGVWLPVAASQAAILSPPGDAKKDVAGMWHYIAQLAGGDLAALSREVQGVADPEIERAASGSGGGYQQQGEAEEGEEEEEGGSGGGGSSGGEQWQQQQRRRSKLPEADYRDGAGI